MVTNKLSKISGVLHLLKYIYPQHVLVAIDKSLFIPIFIMALFFGVTTLIQCLNCKRKLFEPLQIVHILPTQNLFYKA